MTNQASETVVEPVRAHVGEMRVLDQTGDLKIVWSSDKPDEVTQARKMFDDMKAKGYSAVLASGGALTVANFFRAPNSPRRRDSNVAGCDWEFVTTRVNI